MVAAFALRTVYPYEDFSPLAPITNRKGHSIEAGSLFDQPEPSQDGGRSLDAAGYGRSW